MSAQSVDIYCKNQFSTPLPGVLVKVYNIEGTEYYTETLSGPDGVASFLLEEGSYQVRYYKRSTQVPKPQLVEVTTGLNVYDVVLAVVVPPTATDARYCIASGYFRQADGSPAGNLVVQFIAKWSPLLLDGAAVLNERVTVVTDRLGYASIPLIRFGQYDATVQGIEDVNLVISVPDLPQCSLPDLLFPVVASVSFDPPGPYTLAVEEVLELTPTVRDSAGNVLQGTACVDVRWSSSDQSVLALQVAPATIRLMGVSSGTADIQAVRANSSIVRIPDIGIQGVPIPVVVS